MQKCVSKLDKVKRCTSHITPLFDNQSGIKLRAEVNLLSVFISRTLIKTLIVQLKYYKYQDRFNLTTKKKKIKNFTSNIFF